AGAVSHRSGGARGGPRVLSANPARRGQRPEGAAGGRKVIRAGRLDSSHPGSGGQGGRVVVSPGQPGGELVERRAGEQESAQPIGRYSSLARQHVPRPGPIARGQPELLEGGGNSRGIATRFSARGRLHGGPREYASQFGHPSVALREQRRIGGDLRSR